MATTLSSLGFSLHPVLRKPSSSPSSTCFFLPRSASPRNTRILTIVSSSSSSSYSSNQFGSNRDDGFSLDDPASLGFDSRSVNSPKKSVLANLIQEIEPLDVSLIQKEVPPTTLDAMKRTISGMLGLLPSDRFQVLIEALWEPLSKLLVSSMMTGYTLRNAEYRLFLERTLGIQEATSDFRTQENTNFNLQEKLLDDKEFSELLGQNDILSESEKISETLSNNMKSLGGMSPEVQEYIHRLQWQLSSIKKELREVKRKNAALQMQQFVGEEKNDLLDYLRSLQPEKVAELSEPTSPEVKETIHSVVHGLLATLSPKVHSKATPSENPSSGTVQNENEDCAELLENTSLQFQPLISLTRDYLARLLFWCMLLGHHLRGLEYRVELMDLVSLPSNPEKDADGFEPIA